MKHLFNLKSVTLLLAALPFMTHAQTLLDVQCNINQQYTDVTDTVPNMYEFLYDGGIDYIDDGGGDMYDGGNYLNTDLAIEIDYSDDVIIPSIEFGPAGQYFTRELPGFFMLAADIDSIDSFYISGGNGADGSGVAQGSTFSASYGGTNYDVFVKQVSGDGDPSIMHFIIIPENVDAYHSYSTDTDDDLHELFGIEGSTRLYYFLVSSSPDVPLSDNELMAVANTFLSAINGGGSLMANATTTEVCEGETVTLTGSGGTVYTWDNGVNDGVAFTPPVGLTQYTVSGIGMNGCNNLASINICTLELPDFSLTTSDVLFSTDGSVFLTLNGGIFPFTYDWDNDGTGDFDDAQNLTNVGAGTYTVVVEHGNGCSATASATVDSQVGIESNSINDLSVYPNPASTEFTIKFVGAFNYVVTNLAGQVVMSGNGNEIENVSLSQFESGVYMITVANTTSVNTIQLIKQ